MTTKTYEITLADQALLERFHLADYEIQRAVITLLQNADDHCEVLTTGGISPVKKKLDEIQDAIEDASTDLSSLRGMLNVLRGIREDSEFDMMDLCECFVNLANQVGRIQEGRLSPAIEMLMKLERDI